MNHLFCVQAFVVRVVAGVGEREAQRETEHLQTD